MGHVQLLDSMIQDGLWCGHGNTHMGITAEAVAERHGIGQEAQDAFALASQHKALLVSKDRAVLKQRKRVATHYGATVGNIVLLEAETAALEA